MEWAFTRLDQAFFPSHSVTTECETGPFTGQTRTRAAARISGNAAVMSVPRGERSSTRPLAYTAN